jgi:aldehyde dehydrogenase (NAD+)
MKPRAKADLPAVQIFGPVLSVGKFNTEEEAIQLANATTYGLGSGIQSSTLRSLFSRPSLTNYAADDHRQIIRVSSALQAGTVSFGSIY